MNKIIPLIFKAPLFLLVIAAFLASIYVAYTKSYDIGWPTPVLLGLILLLYAIGVYLGKKKSSF